MKLSSLHKSVKIYFIKAFKIASKTVFASILYKLRRYRNSKLILLLRNGLAYKRLVNLPRKSCIRLAVGQSRLGEHSPLCLFSHRREKKSADKSKSNSNDILKQNSATCGHFFKHFTAVITGLGKITSLLSATFRPNFYSYKSEKTA